MTSINTFCETTFQFLDLKLCLTGASGPVSKNISCWFCQLSLSQKLFLNNIAQGQGFSLQQTYCTLSTISTRNTLGMIHFAAKYRNQKGLSKNCSPG